MLAWFTHSLSMTTLLMRGRTVVFSLDTGSTLASTTSDPSTRLPVRSCRGREPTPTPRPFLLALTVLSPIPPPPLFSGASDTILVESIYYEEPQYAQYIAALALDPFSRELYVSNYLKNSGGRSIVRASLPNLAAKEPGQRSLNVFGYYPTQKYLGTGERLLVGNCDAASYANEGECSTLARAALHFFALLVSLLSLSLAALALPVASYRSPVLFDPNHPPLSLAPSLPLPRSSLSPQSQRRWDKPKLQAGLAHALPCCRLAPHRDRSAQVNASARVASVPRVRATGSNSSKPCVERTLRRERSTDGKGRSPPLLRP